MKNKENSTEKVAGPPSLNEKVLSAKIIQPCDKKSAFFVIVNRKPEIQEGRLKLPILADEQKVVKAVNEKTVVIITGEIGSGELIILVEKIVKLFLIIVNI